jgi:anti-sigma factor RsiW
MNCTEAQNDLPELIGGTLPEARRQPLESHLVACPHCRGERDALQQASRLLQAAPPPEVRVDLATLYREAARREQRRLRRWRRAALAAGAGLAALVALTIGLNLEVRLEHHQLVLRWGNPPPQDQSPVRQEVPVASPHERRAAEAERRLRVLEGLVEGLAVDVQSLELAQGQALARLRAELKELRQQAVLHRETMDNDLEALYAERFLKQKASE